MKTTGRSEAPGAEDPLEVGLILAGGRDEAGGEDLPGVVAAWLSVELG